MRETHKIYSEYILFHTHTHTHTYTQKITADTHFKEFLNAIKYGIILLNVFGIIKFPSQYTQKKATYSSVVRRYL